MSATRRNRPETGLLNGWVWLPEEDALLRQLYADGVLCRDMAPRLRRGEQAVYRRVWHLGIASRGKRWGKRFTAEQQAEIRRLWLAGLPLYAMREELRTCDRRIMREVLRQGLPLRERPRPPADRIVALRRSGHTYQQISGALKITIGSVAGTLHRYGETRARA
jgi:transposase